MENITRNMTNSQSSPCSFPVLFTKTETIVKVSALSVILVLSLVGNILVIYVVLASKGLRKGNNLFFMNMAISDMVVPLMILPWEIASNLSAFWPFSGVWGDVTCKMYMFLQNVSPCVSIVTLIHMTIDRFFAIVFPTKIELISDKTRNAMVISTWIIGSVTSSTYLFTMSIKKNNQGNNYCHYSWPKGSLEAQQSNDIYMMFNLLFYFFVPLALLIILYSIILMKMKANKELHSSHMIKKRMAAARRVTVMAVVIVGIFGLFWAPTFVVQALLAFHWHWKPPPVCSWLKIMFTVRFLPLAHAAINPFICFVFATKYRKKVITDLRKARDVASDMLGMSGSTLPNDNGHKDKTVLNSA